MANETIVLMAKAKVLGIPEYRKLSVDELKTAIANAQGTTSKPKGKASATNGAKPKGKGKTAPAPAKSDEQKTTAAKPSAAQGTAKRSSAKPKGKGKASPAKGKATAAKLKSTPTKGKASAKPKAKAKKTVQGRVSIDRSQIDWRAETNVGRTGKRADVMAALRKRKGNYDKVFDDLVGNARKWYPQHDKHNAEKMLRWLINRVAFDFVSRTGQHTSGERAGYGASTKPSDIRRRELREQAAKDRAKAERAAKRAATPAKGKAKKGKK